MVNKPLTEDLNFANELIRFSLKTWKTSPQGILKQYCTLAIESHSNMVGFRFPYYHYFARQFTDWRTHITNRWAIHQLRQSFLLDGSVSYFAPKCIFVKWHVLQERKDATYRQGQANGKKVVQFLHLRKSLSRFESGVMASKAWPRSPESCLICLMSSSTSPSALICLSCGAAPLKALERSWTWGRSAWSSLSIVSESSWLRVTFPSWTSLVAWPIAAIKSASASKMGPTVARVALPEALRSISTIIYSKNKYIVSQGNAPKIMWLCFWARG